ncbi:RDD family protein [Allosaccharopolyspora coralli]|uniref:RDD family protein n=1 Tax=Allosaccharopolyspora coralli TaxID=2665642 RepID=A0A5Q3QCT5_9PSEU|nr:RDD family protein [Allosaccharopolyspora coralli]QGK69285.1 RDD family protein [Allosaccharopolyspora coralli]
MNHPYGDPSGQNPYDQAQHGPGSGPMPQQMPYGQGGYPAPMPASDPYAQAYGHPGYGQAPTPVPPHVGVPSEWGTRVGGSVLDALIMMGAALVVMLVAMGAGAGVTVLVVALGGGESAAVATLFASYIVGLLAILALGFWAHVYRRGVYGQTFGQKIVRIKTVSEETGLPLGVGAAFARNLCHILDSLPCNVGYLAPLWEPKKQTWADRIMSSVVVSAETGTALPPTKKERKRAASGDVYSQQPSRGGPRQW